MLNEITPVVLAGRDGDIAVPPGNDDYWNELIKEDTAADFMEVTTRTMQNWRQKGGGPRFIVLSARCIRYTRLLLKKHADARLRSSTSEAA